MNLRLDWCSAEAARFACEHWHYSKSLPAPPRVHVGVWEDGVFKGAILFSRGASQNLLKPYRLKQTEGCELTRVALKDHKTPVSRMVSIAIKLLKKHSPGLRLIVSFADPMQGHLGAIYQAGNWIFSGMTSPDYFHVDKTGKKWHSRQVRKNGAPVRQFGEYRLTPNPKEMTCVSTLGKYRYLMPLDGEMRNQVEPLRKPYPKRAASIESDAAGVHPEEGGASPTAALQGEGE